MSRHNEVESIICKIRLMGQLVWIWPVDPNSTIIVRILKNVGWFLWTMSILPRIISLLFHAYHNIDKPGVILVETLSTLFLNLEIFFVLLIWKYNGQKHYSLIFQIINYVQSLECDENDVFYKKLRSYLPMCLCNAVFCGVSMVSFWCGPLILPNTPLPLEGWLPFSIDLYTPMHYIIYAALVFEIARKASLCAAFPIMYMLYFAYVNTKIELLCSKLKTIDEQEKLNGCIEEHKKCIWLVDQLNSAVRFSLLTKYANTMMVSIFTGLIIVLDDNFLPIFRAGLFMVLNLMQVLLPTWYADDLYTASLDIPQAIYDSKWTSKCSTKIRKSMLIIMCRSQEGLNISVSGFIPKLTKNFFASFLSLVLSYYMALRVFFNKLVIG